MDISRLKDHIIDNGLIQQVLESLDCHHIRDRGTFISAANPDGDNTTAVQVYKDSLYTINYTRDIKQPKSEASDLFTLVQFYKQCSFVEALQFVCVAVGLEYYHDFDDDVPESIKLSRFLIQMIRSDGEYEYEKEKPVRPISETILNNYISCVTDFFSDDGISYETQQEFALGYDTMTNRITIPIRDELGNLVGVKGRLFERELHEDDLKYMYLEPCPRHHILFGLYRALPYIKRLGDCYVVESEKGVLQAVTQGVDNVIATGGKKVSKMQFEMMSRLCCDIVLCFDKDVEMDELHVLANRFIGDVDVYALVDDKGILGENESPTDNAESFEHMRKNCVVKLRDGKEVIDCNIDSLKEA